MEDKFCKDCQFYIQHYIKNKTRLRAVSYGHCINTMPNGRFRSTDKPCAHYKEKDLEKEKAGSLDAILELLSFISGRLDELAYILNNLF